MSREIINTYDQLKAAANAGFDKRKLVAITYHSPAGYRDVSVHHWNVSSPFFKTAPDAPWYDRGCQTFSLFGGNTHKERKDAALKEAMDWCAKKYGITEWAKNRMGYVPKEVNDNFPLRKREKRVKTID